ncbi:MAG: DUF2207 domain-containing protein [Microbacteriaceae bacterium]|nr:DUF2207 domain-containing protein [Microbacteriaceae bacterium]
MHKRWKVRAVIALAVAVMAAGGGIAGAQPAHADTAAFTFDSLHTEYKLTRDAAHHADLEVTETFQARFPDTDQNHGIIRAIPRSADGRSLHLEVRSVEDGAGAPVPYQSENSGGFTVLRIGDPYSFVHGVQTYVIDYTMRDAVQQPLFQSAQRFTYDVNGTGWAQPFGRVTATLTVADDLTSVLTGDDHCFQGAQGSTAACRITRTGATFQASASDLGPHENLTVLVGFKPGTFAVPLSWQRLVVWILLGLGVVLLGLAIAVRLRSLGNPKGTGIIVPQYAAFPGIGVMEAAELLDERDRAFPALVTELVVTRAAQMTRDDRGTAKTSDDVYALTLGDATVLDDEDSAAVAVLFGSIKPGTRVILDRAEPKIGDRITKLLLEARASVRAQGLIARVGTRASAAVLAGGLVLVVAAFFWLVFLQATGLGSWVHGVVLVIAGLLGISVAAVVWPYERRTQQAVPAYEHLLGIRDYLRLAEADRIRMLQSPSGAETRPVASAGATAGGPAPDGGALDSPPPDNTVIVKLYEKLLPYAILFGIEKEWRAVLGQYWATTPTEVSPTLLPLQTLVLANAFASRNYATTASVASASHSWSGSGGSGSFGGGFSGGGFGGGGGGGW